MKQENLQQNSLKLALMFQAGNYVGREYYQSLSNAGIQLDYVIAVGSFSEQSKTYEISRTAGRWNPPEIPQLQKVHSFRSLKDKGLAELLQKADIDLIIQGGVGILRKDILKLANIGFINVHPGKLPEYRGCSCPEWALFNNDDIYATAHLIDEGVDTGPVICERQYQINDYADYYGARADLYRHCGDVLVDAINIIKSAGSGGLDKILVRQDESKAKYYQSMPNDMIEKVINSFEDNRKVKCV